MIRLVFYTSVIVFFLLWPVNGMTAGLKSTANQNLQHYSDNTLADCVAEVAPEMDLLSFQKKYRHTAEKKCREMLDAKHRKTAVITPDEDTEETAADDKTATDTDTAQDTTSPPTTAQSHNYWRNETAD